MSVAQGQSEAGGLRIAAEDLARIHAHGEAAYPEECCGVLIGRNPSGNYEAKGDPAHPANFGRLCSKGSALGEILSLEVQSG